MTFGRRDGGGPESGLPDRKDAVSFKGHPESERATDLSGRHRRKQRNCQG